MWIVRLALAVAVVQVTVVQVDVEESEFSLDMPLVGGSRIEGSSRNAGDGRAGLGGLGPPPYVIPSSRRTPPFVDSSTYAAVRPG